MKEETRVAGLTRLSIDVGRDMDGYMINIGGLVEMCVIHLSLRGSPSPARDQSTGIHLFSDFGTLLSLPRQRSYLQTSYLFSHRYLSPFFLICL